MPHLRNFNLLGFATLVALLSCITRISNGQCITNFDENVDYFANGNYQTIGSIDSLSGFSIQYNKYYKLLKNGRTGDTYALYLCGSKVPSDVPAGTKTFQVPVERVAIASGFDLVPYLELLGVRKKLKFHPSPVNETSPCVEKMIASGAVTAFDANGDASQYDIFFTDGNDSAGLGNNKRVVVSASNKENGPLNRAEYLYFVSSFFNLEAVAKEVVPTIRKHYNCRKTELEKYYSTNPKPRVAWIKKEAGGSWTMNGLYERQLLSHAGKKFHK
ncbi:hypothetical protein BKA69DRAFT_615819 [Paraphysoderma sedebokerense]|nr:hypothetical protein BKA69DRAFT_615819 [Paraphysoderma sedebokerense]